MNYIYDGDGNRIEKSNGKIYWYGAGTEVLNESDLSGNITDDYVYFGGKRIAHYVAGVGTEYYGEDFLGTSRVISTSAGTACYDADFYPFGGERVVTNTCAQNYKFEGKERDTETGNDDFGARYYSSRFGRWLSPDWSSTPAPIPYANLTNPQTLNLYAMSRNNPETFADLDGHDLQPPGEYNGNVTVAGPGDFGPPPTMTTVNNLGDFGENYYAGALSYSEDPDDYKVDQWGHGSPHIDRTDKDGNLVGRYDEDGNPIEFKGKKPPRIPNSDKGKFGKAAAKLKDLKERLAAGNKKPAQADPNSKASPANVSPAKPSFGPYFTPAPGLPGLPTPSLPIPEEMPLPDLPIPI